jgi:cytochrome c biogenesis protein CcdA
MLLFLLACAGGVLTILSPCILPVLPFVFARSDQPFVRSGLPLLPGMAITFAGAGVATIAAIGCSRSSSSIRGLQTFAFTFG